MLLVANIFEKIDIDKLMSVYKEASTENADYFYPEISDRKEALKKAEGDYISFLKNKFFTKAGNIYFILEEDNEYRSSLRISTIDKRLFYLEALETNPDHRKMGYAVKLLNLTTEYLKRYGSFTIKDSVKKTNEASIKTHKKAGFVIESQKAFNYLKNSYDDCYYGMSYSFEEDKEKDLII